MYWLILATLEFRASLNFPLNWQMFKICDLGLKLPTLFIILIKIILGGNPPMAPGFFSSKSSRLHRTIMLICLTIQEVISLIVQTVSSSKLSMSLIRSLSNATTKYCGSLSWLFTTSISEFSILPIADWTPAGGLFSNALTLKNSLMKSGRMLLSFCDWNLHSSNSEKTSFTKKSPKIHRSSTAFTFSTKR